MSNFATQGIGNTMDDLYVFIDNSFLFIQGYKFVETKVTLSPNKKPQINYRKLRQFISTSGNIKQMVLVGSELPGNLISLCQRGGMRVFTLPRFPDIRTGKKKEKGVDQKIVWEIAKTIFTNSFGTNRKKIILCSGDKDFMPIFSDIQTAGWALEAWTWSTANSSVYNDEVNVFGTVRKLDDEWRQFIDIVDNTRSSGTPIPRRTPSSPKVPLVRRNPQVSP
jgi:uncharacterized LabA/DUF88 family protein